MERLPNVDDEDKEITIKELIKPITEMTLWKAVSDGIPTCSINSSHVYIHDIYFSQMLERK